MRNLPNMIDNNLNKPEGITIIIPQFNEEANLQRGVLAEIKRISTSFVFNWEILIIDDGSEDQSVSITAEFCKNSPNFQLIQIAHRGKAGAIWEGIQRARYNWVLFTDMDQSTPLLELPKLREFMQSHNVIIGSRGNYRHNATLLRKLAGIIFSSFRKLLILREINDTQCGFKLIKTAIAARIFPLLDVIKRQQQVKGWSVSAFDVEFLFIAKKSGAKIKEVEVEWHDQDTSDTKKRKFVKESLGMLRQIIMITFNNLRGKYN